MVHDSFLAFLRLMSSCCVLFPFLLVITEQLPLCLGLQFSLSNLDVGVIGLNPRSKFKAALSLAPTIPFLRI